MPHLLKTVNVRQLTQQYDKNESKWFSSEKKTNILSLRKTSIIIELKVPNSFYVNMLFSVDQESS